MDQTLRERYQRDGFVIVHGLLSPELTDEAAARITEHFERTRMAFHFFDIAAVQSATEAIRPTAAFLLGAPLDSLQARPGALSITQPSRPDADWHWPTPHIDGALERDDNLTEPKPFRIATMTYLSDVGIHGGGTVVWPGSHRTIQTARDANPEKYHKMPALNTDIESGLIQIGSPIELTPRIGDVLFYTCFCAHAGSINITPQHRLSLNTKW
jgi:ectoine hydroxylase-related dioxygenase (phytanoyl-CoA dioxygenase family)